MIEKLREELINDIISELDKSVPAHLSDENNEVHNTITQIIVDSFDEYEWSMNTNGNCELRRNKVENSMVQEAKFELVNYKLHGLTTEYLVRLTDADGKVVKYSITDYYNEEMNEITDTRIWVLTDIVLELNLIENDSKLGKKILTFISNEHFYRGDVIESMFIAGRENRLKKINDELDSFMKIRVE